MEMDGAFENMAFALRCTAEVATRRNNTRAIALCEELGIQLENSTAEEYASRAVLRRVGRRLYWLASDLLYAIKFEMREVLIPFIEVKGPTHEFGKRMFPDYFQWLSDEEHLVPGDLVKILEEDMERLHVALEHIDKALHSQSSLQGR
jgi:hypothetical protein